MPLATNISSIYEGTNDDIRLANWIQASNNYLVKYAKENEKFYPKQVLIKLAEMYLIVAEAKMNLHENDALEYLNTMRRSRILNSNISDKNELNQDVLIAEMRREFLGEGQLFFEYKRLNSPILNVLKDVPASNSVFVLPIPDSEKEYGKY